VGINSNADHDGDAVKKCDEEWTITHFLNAYFTALYSLKTVK
jgi:hypothetical protein